MVLFKEITSRIYYVMVYMKDTSLENIEVMCRNVLVLSKHLLKQSNYTEFLNLAKETFFNPKHGYHIKLFSGTHSPANDLFLEHFLTRLWEFKDSTETSLSSKGLGSMELYEKCYQVFLFYLNYEAKRPLSKYSVTEKLISVFLNLNLTKENKDVCNSIKCLYSIVQLMKGENQENACKLLYQYMGRICEKTILNSSPVASDAVATISVVLERNAYFNEDTNIANFSAECVRYLLQTIKLTVNLNVEPDKPLCEMKDCIKGAKKHTITNLSRFAQKLFVAYVEKLPDNQGIDEEILAIVTQLVIYHFHVLDRLNCPSRMAYEHNDVRRLYSTFAHRSKAIPPAGVLKIFEILLKYALQRNLAVLVNPLAMLLIKYYAETNDQSNCDRVEWIVLLCKHDDPAQSASFDNLCYNWAVKKQKLTKEELTPILQTLKNMKLDYTTEIIPVNLNVANVFRKILEAVAVHNYKAFRVLQECLVELILDESTDQCSEDIVNLLFYATENQIVNYKECIIRNREYFERPEKTTKDIQCNVPLAVIYSLEYQVYNAELRQKLKSLDMNALQRGEAVSLQMLSVQNENVHLGKLRESLHQLQKITSVTQLKGPQQTKQVIGTLKRNIRYFQLAGLEFEEISSSKLLYDLSKELKDTEGTLLAMANLINHVHYIIKDEKCRKQFPKLILTINGEGTRLLVDNLKSLRETKESLQILIVFGIGNIIKLNADLGRLEKSYGYLRTLKQKIDEVRVDSQEPSVNDLQYQMISFQLFLKYAPQSQVNPLMVVRKLFSAVRLLYKACDLYALYMYDVLVELFCFSVPRYETKGLDFYICTVLKYFLSIGSVIRVVDVMLIYANWALCCESLDKCSPIMDYVVGILSNPCISDHQEGAIVKSESSEDQVMSSYQLGHSSINSPHKIDNFIFLVFQFNLKLSQAIAIYGHSSSLWMEIVCFKLNCLMARKNYIDRDYDKSRQRYEESWDNYESLNERISNYSLKMEFQQFYVNALFQLSNVYYKLNMPTKSFRFCEQTTVVIREILANRIALTQEAYFQEFPFKTELDSLSRNSSPISPINIEIAMLMNEKKTTKSSRKKVNALSSSKRLTPIRSSRKAKQTPAKFTIDLDSPEIPIASLPVVVAVDENSSVLGNNVAKPPTADEAKRKTSTRKIPVRTGTTSKSSASNTTSTRKKSTTTFAVPEPETVAVIGSRKTSRRLL